MRNILLVITMLMTIALTRASDPAKHSPKIKIFKNDLAKIYTVFFADTIAREVTVQLKNKQNDVLITESFSGKGFSKPFGLSELRNDTYQFRISYADEIYTEDIELKSEKQWIADAISQHNSYPINSKRCLLGAQ